LIDHCRRLYAVERGSRVIHPDFQLGNSDLLLHLQIDDAGNGGEHVPQLLPGCAQRIEIVAEDLECDLGADAREHVIEPMGDRLSDIDGHGQDREPRANVGDDLRLRPRGRYEIDFDVG
jgi:hypothetical protein